MVYGVNGTWAALGPGSTGIPAHPAIGIGCIRGNCAWLAEIFEALKEGTDVVKDCNALCIG